MTPVQLQIFFWIYVSVTKPPIEMCVHDVRDAFALELEALGLIQKSDAKRRPDDWEYEVTDRGKILIDHILALPLPVQEWKMPET